MGDVLEDVEDEAGLSEVEADAVRGRLQFEIASTIAKFRKELKGPNNNKISYIDPERAAELLYRWSVGQTLTRIKRETKTDFSVVRNLLADYADHIDRWQELGRRVATRSYMQASLLEDELVQRLHERLESGEIEASFVDLKNLTIAKANAYREASLARGQATEIREDRKVVTQEDYEETLRRARERLAEGSVDVESEEIADGA